MTFQVDIGLGCEKFLNRLDLQMNPRRAGSAIFKHWLFKV
jgi:hypothetical protein